MIGFGKRKSRLVMVMMSVLLCSVAVPHALGAQGEPSVSSCSLPPVTLPLFDATPAAAIAVATPTLDFNAGEEASAAQRETFISSLELLIDCVNTGVPAFAYAIFTPEYLATWFVSPVDAYQPAFEQTIAQNVPASADDESLTVDSIENVRVLNDGRLSGRVVLQSDMSWRDTLVLKQVGDDWLIDDVVRESR